MTDERKEAIEYCEYIRKELREYYGGDREDEDGEPAGLWDYINKNALDVEYILDSSFNLIGVKVFVTLNGPTCWIDTREQVVNYSYGGDVKGFCYIDSDIAEEINSMYEDMIPAMR